MPPRSTIPDSPFPIPCIFLRQQVDKPVDRPDFCLADFIAPKKQRQTGLDRCIRGHCRHRHRPACGPFRSRARRLQLHPAQGVGRPSGRSIGRAPASTRAYRILGLCRRRNTRQRSPDRRALSRHSPGSRLLGLPGTQRKKRTLFDLLDAERNADMSLTESFAMLPTAAVSGYYFSHPKKPVLRGRATGQGTGGRLRKAQGHHAGIGRTASSVQPGLRPGITAATLLLGCNNLGPPSWQDTLQVRPRSLFVRPPCRMTAHSSRPAQTSR